MNSHKTISNNTIRVFVGFDQRESVAFHTFSQSLIDNASRPITIQPLALRLLGGLYNEVHRDGSNDFIYSRFLVPFLCDFKGLAFFFDGDMIIEEDIALLLRNIDPECAVSVVQHDYKTKAKSKYLGNTNEDYPRKNWSSVIVWNCGHASNKVLTPDFISNQTGAFLHRFSWLKDSEIGKLDPSWNWLAEEYEPNPNAKLIHYTLGTPCFSDYKDCSQSDRWHYYNQRSNQGFEL